VFLYLPLSSVGQRPLGDIKLLDVVSGDSVSINNFSQTKGMVVLFTSNSCAFDNFYTDRIALLVKTYEKEIQFLLVNSNIENEESINQMNATYPKKKVTIPYLADKEQILMSGLGAKKTPEAFLLTSKTGKINIFYSGALDDNPQVEVDVKQDYLKTNIDRLLAGLPATESIRAVGCSIRKK